MKMTKENFLRYYNKLTGADKTLIFFQFNNMIYLYECEHIAPRWVEKRFESSSKGGWEKYRMYINISEKKKLVKKSTVIMSVEEFETEKKSLTEKKIQIVETSKNTYVTRMLD